MHVFILQLVLRALKLDFANALLLNVFLRFSELCIRNYYEVFYLR